jgi:hypothetical protein
VATWTQAEIDTLRAAVASVILTVTYDGPPRRSITYQSLAEMRALLASMQSEAAAAAGTRIPYRLIATKKGL